MRKTFQFKLYRSKRNRHLHRQINIASAIYNHCIALHKRYYRLFGKSLNKYQLQKHLTKLKKQKRYCYWNQVGSQAVQDIAERIDRGYALFFKSLKSGRKTAPPSFKKQIRYKSITLKQAGYKLLCGNKLKIGGRVYGFHKSRDIEGVVKTVTIKRDTLVDIYTFFSCELPDIKIERTMTGKSAGFDFGLKTFLTPSDATKNIESPLFYKQGMETIKKASGALSRKKKGSNNRKKARLNLARVHKRIVNQRHDYHFKTACKLAGTYDQLFFEDLHIKAMQMMWGRKVSDLGFSSFLRILEHCCKKSASKIVYIDRFFPSSKLCNVCGWVNKQLSLSDRAWICNDCGAVHDRDKNAAINIFKEGASSFGLGDVRPSSMAISV
jgi:putative transposase